MPIELHTPDSLQYQFYPAAGGCFSFKVRAPNDAHIALAPGPAESEPITEIFLGGWGNTKSVIRKNRQKPDVVEVETQGILNAGEFRGFWIRWYQGVVTVGHEGDVAAFMSFEDPYLHPINYIGVCTGWGATGSWQIEDVLCPTQSPCCWVRTGNGILPENAVEGGFDEEPIYVARAYYQGNLIPGKFVPSHGVCYISSDGFEHPYSAYEVLCATPGDWIPSYGCEIPENAMPAGCTTSGETLFIGRANHNGRIICGKVQPCQGCCYVPYDGTELRFDVYDIFVQN